LEKGAKGPEDRITTCESQEKEEGFSRENPNGHMGKKSKKEEVNPQIGGKKASGQEFGRPV